jgi:hypothetical protein
MGLLNEAELKAVAGAFVLLSVTLVDPEEVTVIDPVPVALL